ncbi:hypothetical protein [Streptomyces somaliensis]|uniref:Uncharacterized protein n=1 Tax=Streptomyces somaliensis (strain ATCC 33201 / DSM 40738 / JCM 12659 / KCTC 9044 / NCTC 11332 / NRRL B-12077 / IP 733) TaxID=1134445 RepID=A0AA44IBG6_STRE0|nr:hypothetical protein [Streptomyces somaliensis]NKY12700.1 hypothetical protein [Streptomyces somaliensis DSM 40738]
MRTGPDVPGEPVVRTEPDVGAQAGPEPRVAAGPDPRPEPSAAPADHVSPWFSAPKLPQDTAYAGSYDPVAHTGDTDRLPGAEEEQEYVRAAYEAFQAHVKEHRSPPAADALALRLAETEGLRHPRAVPLLRRVLPDFIAHYQAELEAEHIA